MNGDETAQLIYLVVLGCAIGGYALMAGRLNVSKMLRLGLLWGLIFLGVIAGYGLWQDVADDLMPRQTVFAEDARVEVPRSDDGHYYLVLEANGVPINFVVDTGATDIVLTKEDAERIGIDLDTLIFSGRALTANGEVRSARVRLETLNLGNIQDQNVRASVS